MYIPEGGGDTTRSPKLTESVSSSSLNVAEFHTKLYFSLTCSNTDLLVDICLRLSGVFLIRMLFLADRNTLDTLPLRPRLKFLRDHDEDTLARFCLLQSSQILNYDKPMLGS